MADGAPTCAAGAGAAACPAAVAGSEQMRLMPKIKGNPTLATEKRCERIRSYLAHCLSLVSLMGLRWVFVGIAGIRL